MTYDELIEHFDRITDSEEFLKFDRIENKLHKCPDIHAFLLLDSIAPIPAGRDMVSWATHEEIMLEVQPEDLAKAGVTVEQITDLVRCGVRYDNQHEALMMFV